MLEQVAWLAPSRWAYAATASTMGLVRGQAPEDEDWIALAGAGHYVMALAMLGVLCAAAFGIGMWLTARSARRRALRGVTRRRPPRRGMMPRPLSALEPEMPSPALSVLDLVPVRADQTSADAVAASLELARTADRLGYRRYWVAEHHNMPAVAATNPPVLIGCWPGRRRGSGSAPAA